MGCVRWMRRRSRYGCSARFDVIAARRAQAATSAIGRALSRFKFLCLAIRQIGCERPRPRQRHLAGSNCFGLLAGLLTGRGCFRLRRRWRLADIPLAEFIAVAALGEVEMHMLLVVAVRSRPEH